MKKETLSSIAARTGYSITTVSRVLNGNAEKYRISKATCDAVIKEAQRCNYSSNYSSGLLNTYSKSGLIALFIPSISYPFFADLASVMVAELKKSGYTTIVIDTLENENYLNEDIRSMIARHVEGIIVAPIGQTPEALEHFASQVPVVVIDRYFEDTSLSYVSINNYQGGRMGTLKLLAHGHKKIALLQGLHDLITNRERVRGYRDTMIAEGLEDEMIIVGNDFSTENGYLETKLLLQMENRPTAIFTMSISILIGALKAINEAGLKIPEDLSIITFDENIYMDYLSPAVDRIRQPIRDMAVLTSKILLNKINQTSDSKSQIKMTPVYVAGASIKTI